MACLAVAVNSIPIAAILLIFTPPRREIVVAINKAFFELKEGLSLLLYAQNAAISNTWSEYKGWYQM